MWSAAQSIAGDIRRPFSWSVVLHTMYPRAASGMSTILGFKLFPITGRTTILPPFSWRRSPIDLSPEKLGDFNLLLTARLFPPSRTSSYSVKGAQMGHNLVALQSISLAPVNNPITKDFL